MGRRTTRPKATLVVDSVFKNVWPIGEANLAKKSIGGFKNYRPTHVVVGNDSSRNRTIRNFPRLHGLNETVLASCVFGDETAIKLGVGVAPTLNWCVPTTG